MFDLDGNDKLQVDVKFPDRGSRPIVEIKITCSSDSLLLHWGAVQSRKGKWFLPNRRPDGTCVYKNRALRTPFVKSGDSVSVRIEIDDPTIQAIEFLVFDESQNKWFKNNGNNFYIGLPLGDPRASDVSVPEDLVQIQAYLRWERKGKKMYTRKQEKEEYEAARTELLEEIARGTSIEDLRGRLTKKDDANETKDQPLPERINVPDDLVQAQAYIQWEKAGKPNNPPEQQIKEFDAARKELQLELEKGTSLHEIREKIAKGEVKNKVAKQPEEKRYFLVEKIQRKKRDRMHLLNKYLSRAREERIVSEPQALSAIELFAKAKEEKFDGSIVNKKIFDLSDGKLLVLVARSSSKTKIYLASDLKMPLTLHWALSKRPGEWMAPPSSVLPSGSKSFSNAIQTQFSNSSSDNLTNKVSGDGSGTAKALLDKIAEMESEAQKSFMHRFNIAADLIEDASSSAELGFAGILVWMRFMATRQLIWNKNYNVKPREISKAQDRFIDLLQNVYVGHPKYCEILRMIMSTVGRGGEGDVGQRIRDEILVIQRKNDCKGGMMEEWHQKLHNNTSSDDVVICQALIAYIKSDMDISIYWKTLNENGITKERLLSYDRAIRSEPNFRGDQKDSLLCDLKHYMRTLKAVHSGADLESAISNCMGYRAEELLQFVLEHIEDKNVEALLEGLLEARQELKPLLFKPNNRLKDLIFLDLALDSSVRTSVERGYEELNNASPEKVLYLISLVLENLVLSTDNNEDLIYCLKGWDQAVNMSKSRDQSWALFAKSVLDRTRLALASKSEWYHQLLQPSAYYLGSQLGVDQWAVNIFTEELIRAGSAASLSALLNRFDPILRRTANLGSWQIISPVEAAGYVVVVDELLSVQNKSYERHTILVAKSVRGEEEIPDGTVAVLTPDMPDVLSHVSVRARNSKVCFATCFDSSVLVDLQAKEGKLLHLKPTSADIIYSEVTESELANASNLSDIGPSPSITVVRKRFCGRYAISSDEFTNEMVGAKSHNIAHLKGKVPSWIGIPTSVALPFGAFEEALSDDMNKKVAAKLEDLKKRLRGGDFHVLGEIRRTVLDLLAPSQLVTELKDKMLSSGMPWPGDEGQQRWEQAWIAIKKVWASKWNERAYLSTRKLKLDHDYLCMAVLVQEIINADYAFVIHTTNPSSGDSSEIYVEVVKGLGETLVGAYPGRALSFICKKNDLNSPQVIGYPSKRVGMFIRRSIIFRSDSNGEDLEGYAGAGLYDSVPMDEEEKIVLDYSSDPLITDSNFRQSILSNIARAGNAIEELYGSPQDIEGVVRDGKIYVVQTRPQM